MLGPASSKAAALPRSFRAGLDLAPVNQQASLGQCALLVLRPQHVPRDSASRIERAPRRGGSDDAALIAHLVLLSSVHRLPHRAFAVEIPFWARQESLLQSFYSKLELVSSKRQPHGRICVARRLSNECQCSQPSPTSYSVWHGLAAGALSPSSRRDSSALFFTSAVTRTMACADW